MATAAEKRWSAEDYSLSDDDVYFMDINNDDELTLSDSNFKQKGKISNNVDIYELCKTYYNTHYLSVPMYLTLRHFNISCGDTDALLKNIGNLTRKTPHS